MYGFLFDQTYINMVIIGLIIFLIMFLWRKITVIEGSLFILEKRVDMIKKSDRKDSINKNFESADIVMNEIFKDSTAKNNYCNDINYKCPIENKIQKNKNNIIEISDIINKNNDMIDYINIINDIAPEIKKEEQLSKYIIDETVNDKPVRTPIVTEVTDDAEVAEVTDVTDVTSGVLEIPVRSSVTSVTSVTNVTSGVPDVLDVIDNDIDSVSVSSDITFGSDIDKSMTKKYKNMNVEKLREECKAKSLNTEGTKAMLISRILDYNKKQK